MLALLLVLYSAVDLVELKSTAKLDALGLLKAYLFKLPATSGLLLPSAAALGAGIRAARLRRTGEWDAMQAVGISPRAVFFRMLFVSFCCIPLALFLSFEAGPRATARFESYMRQFDKSPSKDCEGRWTRQAFGYARFGCDNLPDTIIQTDRPGHAEARYSKIDNKNRQGAKQDKWIIWDKDGQRTTHPPKAFLDPKHLLKPVAAPLGNMLLGQSLTYIELEKALADARRMGVSEAPLRAERALRAAASLACGVMPAVLLGLLFLLKTSRTGRAVLLGIFVTILYWIFSTAAWNGVAAGLCSELWLAVGVPIGFIFLFGALPLGWKTRLNQNRG